MSRPFMMSTDERSNNHMIHELLNSIIAPIIVGLVLMIAQALFDKK